jgi:DNA polymerase-3 subunit gamma/tau
VQQTSVAPAQESAPAPSARPGGLDTAAIRRSWPDVLAKVFELRRTTWTFVSEHAQVLDYDGERLLLGIATTGLANTFRRGPHATYVQQALIDVLGIDARVEGVPADGSSLGGDAGVQTIDPNRPARVAEPTAAPARPQPAARPGDQAGPAQDDPDRRGEPGRGGEAPAYGQGRQASTQADWGSSATGGPAAPAWATSDGPPSAAPEPASPFARAKVAVAAEPDPDETPVADDSAISEDDEDIEGLGEIGVPVVERVLGGKVISEEDA